MRCCTTLAHTDKARPMRTTINLAEDAAIAVRHVAQRERISLGEAISALIRLGGSADAAGDAVRAEAAALRGVFALLPSRDEVITPQHVRLLMDCEGM